MRGGGVLVRRGVMIGEFVLENVRWLGWERKRLMSEGYLASSELSRGWLRGLMVGILGDGREDMEEQERRARLLCSLLHS
jgi:hypothetical protein